MSNQLPRLLTRLCVAITFIIATSVAALAQTPSPTPVNPATLPPGQQTTSPTAPPGQTIIPGTPIATPTVQPTPITPAIQEPTFPEIKPQPLPPLPDLTRVGVLSSNVVPLSLTDAIRKALQNNNDIEVSRDDVRFAEQQLRSLQGVYDPIFAVTPQLIRNVTPQTSSLGGAGAAGTTSNTTFNLSPSLFKQFSTGGGNYTVSFANSRQSTSSTRSSLTPFYSSNLSLAFTQPLLRNRSIDANRHAIRVQRKRLEQTDSVSTTNYSNYFQRPGRLLEPGFCPAQPAEPVGQLAGLTSEHEQHRGGDLRRRQSAAGSRAGADGHCDARSQSLRRYPERVDRQEQSESS